MNGGLAAHLNVATTALHAADPLKVKVAAYWPVPETTRHSVAARDVPGGASCWARVKPLPPVTDAVLALGSPRPPKTSSLAAVVVGGAPLETAVVLPVVCAVWSNELSPENS